MVANSLPRGLRNNNPGNIVDGAFAQSLPGYVGSDGRFAVFNTLESGAHAMQRLLQGYGKKGLNTVESIINRWAPPSENDTGSYAKTVASRLGVKPNEKIDLNDPDTLAGLSSAMAGVENGVPVELGFAASPKETDSEQAVNALAKGTLQPNMVRTVQYVPPPNSGQQGNFQPLFDNGDQQPQPQQQPNAAPIEAQPLSAPQDDYSDVQKAWGLDGERSAPAVSPAANEMPQDSDDALVKAWGLDKTDAAPAENAASASAKAPANQTPAIGLNDAVRSVATGVPIIGGLLNKADAATNALIAPAINPMLSPENRLAGDTWSERYANSLAEQQGMDQAYAQQHPIANAVGNVAGGVAGTIPIVVAAPGLIGASTTAPLTTNMLMGGLSGAAIGAADSGIRSNGDLEQIKRGAEIGGVLGAAGPAVAKGAGYVGNKLLDMASGTNSAARNVAGVLDEIGMTPQEAKNVLARMGPNATLADIDPALSAEAGGLAAQGGAPTSILKKAMAARAAGADDRIAQAVDATLGPKPDALQILDDIRQRAAANEAGSTQAAKDALDSAMGPSQDPHTVLMKMISERSAAAQPLYDKAMEGGSIAPLTQQFESAFNDASAAVNKASRELSAAQQKQTLAAAETSRAGNNVYASSGANAASQEAQTAVEKAEQNLAAANAEKESVLGRLRKAQADGTANAPGAIWNPRIQQFLDDSIMKAGLAKGVRLQRLEALAEGKPFNPTEYAITGADDAGNPIVGSVPNMRTLNVVKKGLDDMVEAAKDPVTGKLSEEGRAIDKVRSSFLAELDKANPDYKAARQSWAGPTKTQEAFDRGLNIFRNQSGSKGVNTTPAALDQFMKTASEGEKEAIKAGARSAFKQQMQIAGDQSSKAAMLASREANQQKLASILGSDEAKSLTDQLNFKFTDPVGEAFDKGMNIFSNRRGTAGIEDTPDALKKWLGSASDAQTEAARQGARQALEQALNSARQGDLSAAQSMLGKSTANRQKLEMLFPNAKDLFDSINNEIEMKSVGQRIAQNSATAERQAIAAKYAPKTAQGGGMAEAILGESLAGGPGAVAGYLGRNTLNALRGSISEGARNRLMEQTARGLSATGTEQQQFINQLMRAARTAKGSQSISNAANIGTNLLFRAASDQIRQRQIPPREIGQAQRQPLAITVTPR